MLSVARGALRRAAAETVVRLDSVDRRQSAMAVGRFMIAVMGLARTVASVPRTSYLAGTGAEDVDGARLLNLLRLATNAKIGLERADGEHDTQALDEFRREISVLNGNA